MADITVDLLQYSALRYDLKNTNNLMQNDVSIIPIRLPAKAPVVFGAQRSNRIGAPAKELVKTICIPFDIILKSAIPNILQPFSSIAESTRSTVTTASHFVLQRTGRGRCLHDIGKLFKRFMRYFEMESAPANMRRCSDICQRSQ